MTTRNLTSAQLQFLGPITFTHRDLTLTFHDLDIPVHIRIVHAHELVMHYQWTWVYKDWVYLLFLHQEDLARFNAEYDTSFSTDELAQMWLEDMTEEGICVALVGSYRGTSRGIVYHTAMWTTEVVADDAEEDSDDTLE
ncbi:MAG: hypothetical protein MMC23_007354 [Stictis urceolatum]|nr:hypothetical protein [Stictis urceolata]